MLNTDILLVCADPAQGAFVSGALAQSACTLAVARTIREAESVLGSLVPDALILDCGLGGALLLLRRLRAASSTRRLPIISFSAGSTDEEDIKALECGADDHLLKPFSARELAARFDAVLRSRRPALEVVELGALRIDAVAREVRIYGRRVDLQPAEVRLLLFLATHPNRLYERRELVERVCTRDATNPNTINTSIRRLRRALAPSGHDKLICTSPGGYALRPPRGDGRS